jgi:hypothetical protein
MEMQAKRELTMTEKAIGEITDVEDKAEKVQNNVQNDD